MSSDKSVTYVPGLDPFRTATTGSGPWPNVFFQIHALMEEAIEFRIDGMRLHGEPVPQPSKSLP
jgi:hypothetical protein